jgi:hypothetical protein
MVAIEGDFAVLLMTEVPYPAGVSVHEKSTPSLAKDTSFSQHHLTPLSGCFSLDCPPTMLMSWLWTIPSPRGNEGPRRGFGLSPSVGNLWRPLSTVVEMFDNDVLGLWRRDKRPSTGRFGGRFGLPMPVALGEKTRTCRLSPGCVPHQ